MPIIIANILRSVFIWLVQAGATAVVFSVIEKIFDALQEWVRDTLSISEDDSRAIIVNYTLDAIAFTGAGAAVIYGKIPTTLARKIGLSGGKAVKQKVSATAESKLVTTVATDKIQTSFLSKLRGYIIGTTPTDLLMRLMLLQQMGDWYFFKNGMVMDLFKSVFGDGIVDKDAWMKSPGPFSEKEFDNYVRAIESQNIIGIEYPVGSFLYSKEQLAKLVSWVYGQQLAKSKTATATSIVTFVAPYLLFDKKVSTTTTSTPVKTTASTTALTVPKVQVFTGVLSQGVLGRGLEFSARPDDLIESAQEMLDAASNNLAPFISSLPNRITYQVKVVNSITTKDGFMQKGSVTQIVTGYDSKGMKKYKTVVNKFATLDIFILNDKNTRVKITTIVLGPVDSVKFQVGQGTITAIETGLQKVASTSNINAITGISTNNPITVTPPTTSTSTPTIQHWKNPFGDVFYSDANASVQSGSIKITKEEYDRVQALGGRDPKGQTVPQTTTSTPTTSTPSTSGGGGSSTPTTSTSAPTTSSPAPAPTPAPAPVVITVKPGASAQTLYDWYTANGKALPSVGERATLYQQYGLGQASYYTGTSEQNTNLLNKLKSM